MKIMFYFLIFILALLFMPIRIRIIRNDKFNDIDIYFIKVFNVRLDFDKFIKKMFVDSDSSNKVTINKVLYNLGILIKSSNMIKSTISRVVISKLTWIVEVENKNEEANVFLTVASFNIIVYLRNLIYKYFKEVKNEYYSVQTESSKIDASFEVIFDFRIIYFILSVFKNFKDIKKIKNFIKKGSEKDA